MSNHKTPFNLNQYVWVKLTNRGKRVLQEKHDELFKDYPNPKPKPVEHKEDGDGWSKWQLWNLMSQLGNEISFGSLDHPFELDILFENNKLNEANEKISTQSVLIDTLDASLKQWKLSSVEKGTGLSEANLAVAILNSRLKKSLALLNAYNVCPQCGLSRHASSGSGLCQWCDDLQFLNENSEVKLSTTEEAK